MRMFASVLLVSSLSAHAATPGDLYFVQKNQTGANTTLVSALSASSNFQSWSISARYSASLAVGDSSCSHWEGHEGAPMGAGGAGCGACAAIVHSLDSACGLSWWDADCVNLAYAYCAGSEDDYGFTYDFADYNLDGQLDLYEIRAEHSAGYDTEVEVRIYAGPNFTTQLLSAVTPMYAAPLTPRGARQDVRFFVERLPGDVIPDIIVVSHDGGSGTTEVHGISGVGGYTAWNLHTATALHPTDHANWQFDMADYNGDGWPDLYAIGKNATGSGATEVHILDGASNFSYFLLHMATPLEQNWHLNWTLSVGYYDNDNIPDLIGTKLQNTGSGVTEVHVLGGAYAYGAFTLHTTVPMYHAVTDRFAVIFR